jgi:hypothetical protein
MEGDTSEQEMARQRERASKLERFNEVLRLLKENENKYADGGGINLLSDTSGVGLQNVGGTSFSNVDLTPQMDLTNPMFANGGELHRSQDGMYAMGGRTSKDYMGNKTKEQWGKYDLSEMYENNLDLMADVVDYIKDLQKEVGQSYAKDFVYEMMDVLKEGKITYNDGATLTFAKGGITEHGLRIGDKILSAGTTLIVVQNDDGLSRVSLNKGTREYLGKKQDTMQ